jgi:hypothetical protein
MQNLSWMFLVGAACTSSPGLVGNDLDAVIQQYGPPVHAGAGPGSMQFAYHTRSGELLQDAVLAVDGVVVRCAADLVPNRPTAALDQWVGARIESVVAALGPARAITPGTASVAVEFASGTAMVVDGRVLGFTSR